MSGLQGWSLCLCLWLVVGCGPVMAQAATCGTGEIINIRGEARVTPATPLGTALGNLTSMSSFVRNSCEYDVGNEEEAMEWSGEKDITLVLRPNARHPKVETPYGFVLALPGVTDRIGVGLRLVSSNGKPVSADETEIVIGHAPKEAENVAYFFNGSNVHLFPPGTNLQYQAIKVKESTASGIFYISNYPDLFEVDWYVDYDNANRRLVATTPVGMTLGFEGLRVNVSGCSLSSLRESLPKKPRADLRARGTVSEAKALSLPVTCYGTGTVNLSISPNNRYSDAQGVGLPTGSGEGLSQGVGIQLLSDGTSKAAWDFDRRIQLGEANVGEGARASFNVPLWARYYQTDDAVRPGGLNVGFTATLEYE
ncbi:fimbrial protein [Bordetella trematum]|uniref:fimbrial protein n=1 Tax=Bordetella trematum TaxID=123899 RepID=UPI0015C56B21|nr:fimbrial protein [Bordetella trematum]